MTIKNILIAGILTALLFSENIYAQDTSKIS